MQIHLHIEQALNQDEERAALIAAAEQNFAGAQLQPLHLRRQLVQLLLCQTLKERDAGEQCHLVRNRMALEVLGGQVIVIHFLLGIRRRDARRL